jgi:hypothetical protein
LFRNGSENEIVSKNPTLERKAMLSNAQNAIIDASFVE